MKVHGNQNRAHQRPFNPSNRTKWGSRWAGITIFILFGLSLAFCNFALNAINLGQSKECKRDEYVAWVNPTSNSSSQRLFTSFKMFYAWYTAVALLPLLSVSTADSFEQDCAAFISRSHFSNTTVYISQYLAAGANISTSGQLGPSSQKVSADVCRITAYTATSNRSGINFETWLPRKWTGRFMSHGNGGLAGCMVQRTLSPRISLIQKQILIMETWHIQAPLVLPQSVRIV
jgi:hypothetical protein